VVTERHTIPEEAAIARLIRFTVAVLADDILHGVQLATTVIRIYYYLLSSENLLLSSIHKMILMHAVLLPLTVVLLLLPARTAREHRARVKVIVVCLRLVLLVGAGELARLAWDLLLLDMMVIVVVLIVMSYWSGYFVGLWVHNLLLVLADLAGPFRIRLPLVASLADFVVSAVAALIHLLHLVLVLLESSLIIINYNLLFGTSVTVGRRRMLALRRLKLGRSAASGPETLLIQLAIIVASVVLTVPLLLLGLHLQVLHVLLVVLVLRLAHELVVDFDALRRRVAHPFYFSIVVLHLYLLQSLVGDFADYVGVTRTTCGLTRQRHGVCLARYHLRGRFCGLRADLARLGVLPTAYLVRRVLNRHLRVAMMAVRLRLHLLLVALLLRLEDGLLRLEVLANALVYRLLPDFVIVRRLHLDHIFQIVDVARSELLALGVGPASARELLVDVDASVALGLCRGNFQRRLVLLLHRQTVLSILLPASYD
jgi:hypothetical protein